MIEVKKYSVLMAIHSGTCPKYLNEALSSILQQTIKPCQVIVVIDGEVDDKVRAVVNKALPVTMCLTIQNEINVGFGKSLNIGLAACNEPYVMRLDPDDICEKDRAERQLKELNSGGYDVVYSDCHIIGENSEILGVKTSPRSEKELRFFAKLRNPIIHPSVMFRLSSIQAIGGYPPYRRAQDYALWGTVLRHGGKFARVPGRLVKHRIDANYFRRRNLSSYRDELDVLQYLLKIGFLKVHSFFLQASLRLFARSLPSSLGRLLYQSLLAKKAPTGAEIS